MRNAVAILLLGLALASPAHAQSAASLYASGEFRGAADRGEQEGGAAGYLIAARALLAMAIVDFRGADAAAWLDRAQRDAEAALSGAPNSVQARLQLATALGMKGRRASLEEAINADYARRGRALIEDALKRAPQDSSAHALLGVWNLEVVRRGGVLGSAFMGASTRAGIRAFERARVLAPSDPVIAFQYGLALLSLHPSRYAGQAGALFEAAANCAPRDAFEANMRDEARRLSNVLTSEGPVVAAATAAAAYL
ncbi:MAG TPA: hypothetical protein VG735_12640 [Caulobacterales bacterium]|nr:hypothetical protein [Caulobacterales bacterium]